MFEWKKLLPPLLFFPPPSFSSSFPFLSFPFLSLPFLPLLPPFLVFLFSALCCSCPLLPLPSLFPPWSPPSFPFTGFLSHLCIFLQWHSQVIVPSMTWQLSWRDHDHPDDHWVQLHTKHLELSYQYEALQGLAHHALPDNLWKEWVWQGWYHHHHLLPTWDKPAPTIPLGPRWQSNMEFYDYQKVNGLPLPRTIQPTVWSQSQNIAGYDPLTLPLSRVLRGGSDNFWLRILASGKAVYLVPMGEVSHSAFVTAILTEFRNRGLDLTQVAQSRATQEGLTLDDSAALRHFATTMTSQLQAWIPNPQHEAQAQDKIAALQAELAALKSRTIPVVPSWHWLYLFPLVPRSWFGWNYANTYEKNIAAVGKWWAAQPDDATTEHFSNGYMFWHSWRKNHFQPEANIFWKFYECQLPWPPGSVLNWRHPRICLALSRPWLYANTRLEFWLRDLLWHYLRASTFSLLTGFFRHVWWCSMSCIIHRAMASW